MDKRESRDFLAIGLQYFIDRGETANKKEFLQFIESNVSEEVGEKIMTIAEQLREEGKLQGKIEGKLEAAKEMFSVWVRNYTYSKGN